MNSRYSATILPQKNLTGISKLPNWAYRSGLPKMRAKQVAPAIMEIIVNQRKKEGSLTFLFGDL